MRQGKEAETKQKVEEKFKRTNLVYSSCFCGSGRKLYMFHVWARYGTRVKQLPNGPNIRKQLPAV
jgi:hypothetical protein